MEDLFTYVIVFGLLIVFAVVFLYKKEVKRVLMLSRQQLGSVVFTVSEIKQHKSILTLVLELNIPSNPSNFFIELIDAQRNKEQIPMQRFSDQVTVCGSGVEVDYQDLKTRVEQLQKTKMTFRFGYSLSPVTKIKSHELAFSKHWNIYKVDSGRYN